MAPSMCPAFHSLLVRTSITSGAVPLLIADDSSWTFDSAMDAVGKPASRQRVEAAVDVAVDPRHADADQLARRFGGFVVVGAEQHDLASAGST